MVLSSDRVVTPGQPCGQEGDCRGHECSQISTGETEEVKHRLISSVDGCVHLFFQACVIVSGVPCR